MHFTYNYPENNIFFPLMIQKALQSLVVPLGFYNELQLAFYYSSLEVFGYYQVLESNFYLPPFPIP